MVRSLWIGAAVVGLAGLLGLAWGQYTSTVPSRTPARRERFITVQEEGRPGQRCKLLKTWQEKDGTRAYQVQAVQTGEILTIAESGPANLPPGQRARAMATRIFHWNRDNTPPSGAPVPPPNATVLGTPITHPGAAHPAPVVANTPPSVPARVATPAPPKTPAVPQRRVAANPATPPVILPQPFPPPTPSRPINTPPAVAQLPRPSTLPPAPAGPKPAALPTLAKVPPRPSASANSGPTQPAGKPTASGMPVIVQGPAAQSRSTPSTAAAPSPQPRLIPCPSGTVVSKTPACGTCGPSTCPCPCCPCPKPACCCVCQPPPRQTLLGKLFKPSTPCAPVVCCPTPSKPATQPGSPTPRPTTSVAQAPTEPARPRDWRESWGKVENWDHKQPPAKVEKSQPEPQRTIRAPLPAEQPRRPDPLKDPAWYRDMALKDAAAKKPQLVKAPVTPAPVAPAPAAPMRIAPAPVAAVPMRTRQVVPMSDPSVPPGMASVMAATSPQLLQPERKGLHGQAVEVPANEGNAFWSPPAPLTPQERALVTNAFPPRRANPYGPEGMPPEMVAMASRPPAPPVIDSGVPSAMGNAFTVAGTARPIPANFGPTPQEPNGFGPSTPEVAQGPVLPPRPIVLPPYPPQPMIGLPQQAYGPVVGINPLMTVPPRPPAATSPMAAEPSGVSQLLETLKESLYPSQREWAAERLGEQDFRNQPQAIQGLTKAARDDPAATVRAACVHALAHMKANTTEVVAVVQGLKADRDPRVRQEVDEALSALGAAAVPRQDSGIRRVSAEEKTPR